MPNTVLVWDNQTGTPASIDLDQYQAGVDSGRYRPYDQTQVVTEQLGARIPVAPTDVEAEDHPQVDPTVLNREAVDREQREAFDTATDKAFTFAEGVADSVSLGLLHQTGDEADIRRDVNSGYAFAGQLSGLAVALADGGEGSVLRMLPASKVAAGGEELGAAAADAILGGVREGETGARTVGRRAISEGVTQGILAGAAATGHEVTDALIDDKPFAADHIISEAGLGTLLGGGFGTASELFSRAAARYADAGDIAAQGGVIDPKSIDSSAIHDAANSAISAWDEGLEQHRVAVGALKVAQKAGALGPLGEDFIASRAQALQEAEAAREVLGKYDVAQVLAGEDPKLVHRYLSALDDYGDAFNRLDRSMRSGGHADLYAPPVGRAGGLDDLNAFQDRLRSGEGFKKRFGDEAPAAGEENLGGKETPSSGNRTGAGTPKAMKAVEREAAPVSESMIEPGMEPAPGRSPLQAFSHDVEHAAAGIEGSDLKSIHAEMQARGGEPGHFASFKERMGRAAQEGHVKLDPEGNLIKSPEFRRPAGEPPPKWSKRDRFHNKGASDTQPGGLGPELENFVKAPTTPPAARAERPGLTKLEKYQPAEVKAAHQEHVAAERERAKAGRAKTEMEPTKETGAPNPDKTVHSGPPKGMVPDGVKPGSPIDDFLRRLQSEGPRYSPGDVAAGRVRDAMDRIRMVSGGRTALPKVAEVARMAGLPASARGPLAEQLGNVWGLRQLSRAAADTGAKGGSSLAKKLVAGSGRGAMRAAMLGEDIAKVAKHGAAGALAQHVMSGLMGGAAGLASSVGRARNTVLRAVDRLLNGRAGALLRATPLAAHYSYDGSPPTADLHARVTQLQQVTAHPDLIRQRVKESLGDLGVVHPTLAAQVEDNAVRMLGNLKMRAPVFVWNMMGEARAAGERAVKQFREYEDVTHDPSIAVDAIARGNITETQAAALREQYPAVLETVTRYLLEDPEKLGRLPEERIKTVEKVLGFSLRYSGPDFVLRQQGAWAPPKPTTPQKGAGAITAPSPTPGQMQPMDKPQ